MKRFAKLLNFENESGSALVMVAISLVALLGFTALVIDGGRLYIEKSKLQKALDSAVLGGAQELHLQDGGDEAKQVASRISQNNGFPLLVDSELTAVEGEYVKAEKVTSVSMTFAKVIGIPSVTVHAKAKAVVAPLKKANRLAPIAVLKDSIPDGTELNCGKDDPSEDNSGTSNDNGSTSNNGTSNGNGSTSNNGNGNGNGSTSNNGNSSNTVNDNSQSVSTGNGSLGINHGNCGFLRLNDDDHGGQDLADAITNGGSLDAEVDGTYVIDTEPGGKVGPVRTAINGLITSDNEGPFSVKCGAPATADNSCKRVITVAVIDNWDDCNGNCERNIVGFASYWLQEMDGKKIIGQFIKWVEPGEIGDGTVPEIGDYATYGIKLTE